MRNKIEVTNNENIKKKQDSRFINLDLLTFNKNNNESS